MYNWDADQFKGVICVCSMMRCKDVFAMAQVFCQDSCIKLSCPVNQFMFTVKGLWRCVLPRGLPDVRAPRPLSERRG